MSRIPFRISFLLIAVLFFGFFIDAQFENINELERELQTTHITLSAIPEIESSTNTSSNDYVRIFVEEYPEFIFRIGNFRYEVCDNTILDDLKKGDKVEIKLKRNELESKLLKRRTPSFLTKYFHWNKVEVYQLKYENKEYLNLHQLKILLESNRSWRWGFLLLGLASIGLVFIKY